jgi:hypothetical protein
MKKIIFLILLTTLFSCSKQTENKGIEAKNIVVKKVLSLGGKISYIDFYGDILNNSNHPIQIVGANSEDFHNVELIKYKEYASDLIIQSKSKFSFTKETVFIRFSKMINKNKKDTFVTIKCLGGSFVKMHIKL